MDSIKPLLLKTIGIMLVLSVSSTVLGAASYPGKPVRLIVRTWRAGARTSSRG